MTQRIATAAAYRVVTLLVGCYVALSVLTVAAIVVLSGVRPDLVNPQAWVRGVIVAGTSILTRAFARAAARGRPRALVRLRIVVLVILVAIAAVLAFVPLPRWMVIEQATCGLLLLATAIIVFRVVTPAEESTSMERPTEESAPAQEPASAQDPASVQESRPA